MSTMVMPGEDATRPKKPKRDAVTTDKGKGILPSIQNRDPTRAGRRKGEPFPITEASRGPGFLTLKKGGGGTQSDLDPEIGLL